MGGKVELPESEWFRQKRVEERKFKNKIKEVVREVLKEEMQTKGILFRLLGSSK